MKTMFSMAAQSVGKGHLPFASRWLGVAGACSLSLVTLVSTAHAEAGVAALDSSVEVVELEEVVVTAQKTEETLQRVPVSVSVMTGKELNARQLTTVEQIFANVPGVTLQKGNAAFVVNIRGVTNNVGGGADYPTAMNTDGIYNQTEVENRFAAVDVSRIEVLRGPQGTLYGGNALGGTVNVISNDPDLSEAAFRLSANVGNYSQLGGQGTFNIPLSTAFGLRAFVSSEKRDTYLTHGVEQSNSLARLKARFQPNDDLDLVVTAAFAQVKGDGSSKVNAPESPDSLDSIHDRSNPWENAATPVVNGQPYPTEETQKLNTFNARLNLNVGFGVVTFIPNYTKVDVEGTSAEEGSRASSYMHHKRTSYELRLGSKSAASWKWTVGGYYQQHEQPTGTYNIENGDATGVSNSSRQTAVFAQTTMPVTDGFRLTAGARVSKGHREEQDVATSGGQSYLNTGEVDYRVTTWKGGFELDMGDSAMLYGSVSTGFRSGGLQTVVPNANNVSLKSYSPMELTAYAVGYKMQFLDRRAQLNSEVFFYDYKNYQVGDSYLLSGQMVTDIYNAKVSSYGGESELLFQVTGHDRINASASYLSARFGNQTGLPSVLAIDNTAVDHSPKWKLRAGYEHRWDTRLGSITAAADYNYTGRQKVIFATNCYALGVACEQGAYHSSNANLGYQSSTGRWQASAYVRNIENYAVITNYSRISVPGRSSTLDLGAPRTFGVTASFSF